MRGFPILLTNGREILPMDIATVCDKMPKATRERNKQIVFSRAAGETFAKIGARYDITPWRVQEIWNKIIRKAKWESKIHNGWR